MKICVIGDGQAIIGKHPGGSELQTFLFAKAMVLAGFDVTFIAYNLSVDEIINDPGFKIIVIPNWNKGKRGWRFLFYRLPGFISTVWKEKPDFYFGRSLSYWHGITAIIAKLKGRKYIYSVAHDSDLLPFIKRIKLIYQNKIRMRELIAAIWLNELFSFAIKRFTNVYFVQNNFQLKQLENKNAYLINNIFENENLNTINEPRSETKKYDCIYVGSLSARKGSKYLLSLVNELPNKRFIIVGSSLDNEGDEVLKELKNKSNVEIAGQKDRKKVLELMSESKILINTSPSEGFPNVFLEAWSVGIPVASLFVNPSNVFQKSFLGKCFNGNFDEFVKCISQYNLEDNRLELIKYVYSNYSMSSVSNKIKNALLGI